jgi:hypothetical protein
MILVTTEYDKDRTYTIWGDEYHIYEVVEQLKDRLAKEGGVGFEVIEVDITRRFHITPTIKVVEDDIL